MGTDKTVKRRIPLSFEIFPPKADAPLSDILVKLGDFAKLSPEYISVTYGTDGSNAPRTLEITEIVRRDYGIRSVAHLTCMNATHGDIADKLLRFKSAGVTDILALRGDRRDGLRLIDFNYAVDLISFINKAGGFSVCAACYPEGHAESGGIKNDVEIMKKKDALGVTHFVSQLFFDNGVFMRLLDLAAAGGIKAPIHAGVMPITNIKQLAGIVKVSGVKIPDRLARQIGKFEGNPQALKQAGMNFALEQISELAAYGVSGVHLYTMNSPDTARYIRDNTSYLFE
ncbi:MAG: methylenetetrahydrofolate reductase [Clostridiaceae bacterium]|jgi:methylenetetrahydrofolate reductase (NADPH)|nr:methylenetetrahydrofolate reductase [Clostridiaceae bacterium]